MQIVTTSLISLLLASVVGGCASEVSREMRRGGIESKHLYREAAPSKQDRELDIRRAKHMIARSASYEPYTRNALNETEQLFKLLPNPKISIYVYPHMSTRDNAPVPGYTTAVSLYQSDEYALPDELLAQGVVQETTPRVEKPPVSRPDDAVLTPEEMSLEARRIRKANERYAQGGAL